jgi:hypothetical protein
MKLIYWQPCFHRTGTFPGKGHGKPPFITNFNLEVKILNPSALG